MVNIKNNFVTILTVDYPHQLSFIRGLLESEEIEYFIQDELTIQTNPFYSNAIGGIKLQVREKDVKEAIQILRDYGYISSVEEEEKLSVFMAWFENITSAIPLLKNIQTGARLILTATLLAVVFTVSAYVVIRPSTYKRLTANNWCLERVDYDGKNYAPQTTGLSLKIESDPCPENITFEEDGEVIIPGFSTPLIYGAWHLDNNTLQISKTDTLGIVFEGSYSIKFSDNNLMLTSDKTILYCRVKESFHYPFLF